MSRIFITGSSDGLGLMAAQLLVEQGHSVVLHARNTERAEATQRRLPGAEAIVTGDLASLQQMRSVADQVNALGSFDAIIHNAALGYREPQRVETEDGFAHVFAINSLAPYVLTALIHPPRRLIYISSELHKQGDPTLRDLKWTERPWQGQLAYSDSKLHNVLLAFATARRLPGVLCNTLTPGWVQTKMGGPGANDDLDQAHRTQAWLAAGDDPASQVSGKYFYHFKAEEPLAAALDSSLQIASSLLANSLPEYEPQLSLEVSVQTWPSESPGMSASRQGRQLPRTAFIGTNVPSSAQLVFDECFRLISPNE